MNHRRRRNMTLRTRFDQNGRPLPEQEYPLWEFAKAAVIWFLEAADRSLVASREAERQAQVTAAKQQAVPQTIIIPMASQNETLALVAPPRPKPADSVTSRWRTLIRHPGVILLLGRRGSAKTTTALWLLEILRDIAAPYAVGPRSLEKLLPEWIGVVANLEDAPPNAVVAIDEAYLTFSSRNSMSSPGRSIAQMINLSRQRNQTLIFVVQEARQLDVNVVSQADVIAIKELSEISRNFERKELQRFTDPARSAFAAVQGDKRSWTWVFSEQADFAGMVLNEMPSFWRPALSRAFAAQQPETPKKNTSARAPRKGTRTPREELSGRAKALHAQGYSYGEIAQMMGLPKSTVWDLVNGE